MKQSLPLLVSICLISLASCQKKQYASFQKSSEIQYAQETKNAVAKTNTATEVKAEEIALISAPVQAMSASNAEGVITEADATTATAKTESVENKTTAPNASAKKKITFVQKVKAINQLKKLSKKVSKQSKATANPKSGDPDTLALISLIAGIAGLILLFASGLVGLLLGLTAIILGVLSYRNTNKRGMAIAGTILGGLIILIFLIAVIFVAALLVAS